MKIKLLLIALIFSVCGYGQNLILGITSDGDLAKIKGPIDLKPYLEPTEFTNAPAVIEYGTCVYLNRNDRITIAKQAERSTSREYFEDGNLLIASQEITYKTKYGINIPEDAVILFKPKPKK